MEGINHLSQPIVTPKKKIPHLQNKRVSKVYDEILLDKQSQFHQLIKANPKTLTKLNIDGIPKAPQDYSLYPNEKQLTPKRVTVLAKMAHLLQHNKAISNLTYKIDENTKSQFEMSFIISSLKTHHQATSLHLKLNSRLTCTPSHLKSLSIILSNFKRLTSLTIDFPSDKVVNPQHITSLFFALTRLKSLTSLSLSFFNVYKFDDSCLQALSSCLSRFTQLKSLSVNLKTDRTINPAAIRFLAPTFKKLVSLQALDVSLGSSPKVERQAIIEFFSSIKDIKTLTSLTINLKGYLDYTTTLEPISTGLNMINCPLKAFIFRRNLISGDVGLSAVSKVLQQKFPSLENLCLEFSKNGDISHQDASDLASALHSLHSLSSLQLDLSLLHSAKRIPTIAQMIGSSIKSLTHLKVLDLNLFNQILDKDQFGYLAESLEGLTSLRQLSLQINLQSATDEDFKVFTKNLRNFTGLSSLTLNFSDTHKLHNKSIVTLGSALKDLIQLRNLYVKIGQFLNADKQIPESLATALQSLPLLTSVTFNLCHFSLLEGEEDSFVPMFKALGQLKFLKKVVLVLPSSRWHSQAYSIHLKHVQDKEITWMGCGGGRGSRDQAWNRLYGGGVGGQKSLGNNLVGTQLAQQGLKSNIDGTQLEQQGLKSNIDVTKPSPQGFGSDLDETKPNPQGLFGVQSNFQGFGSSPFGGQSGLQGFGSGLLGKNAKTNQLEKKKKKKKR